MTAIRALGDKGLAVEGIHLRISHRPPVECSWVADIRRDIFSASKTAVGQHEPHAFRDDVERALLVVGPPVRRKYHNGIR